MLLLLLFYRQQGMTPGSYPFVFEQVQLTALVCVQCLCVYGVLSVNVCNLFEVQGPLTIHLQVAVQSPQLLVQQSHSRCDYNPRHWVTFFFYSVSSGESNPGQQDAAIQLFAFNIFAILRLTICIFAFQILAILVQQGLLYRSLWPVKETPVQKKAVIGNKLLVVFYR